MPTPDEDFLEKCRAFYDDTSPLTQDIKRLIEIAEKRGKALFNLVGAGPKTWPNDDEQGGCIYCGGHPRRGLYAYKIEHHAPDCNLVAAFRALFPETIRRPDGRR